MILYGKSGNLKVLILGGIRGFAGVLTGRKDKEKMGDKRLLQEEEAEDYIVRCRERMTEKDGCAVFLIEFNLGREKEQIRKTEKYRRLLKRTYTVLSSMFRGSDLITCVEDETFLVFICGRITEKNVLDKADSICANLQFSVEENLPQPLTFSTGAYMVSGCDFTVETLLKQARQALEKAKRECTGSYCVRASVQGGEERETVNTSRIAYSEPLAALLNFSDLGICFLEVRDRDQIRATYISPGFYRMEGIEAETKPVPCLFENLGIYPEIQEEYRYMLLEAAKGSVITHVHRISGDGKNWRWRRVQAVRTEFSDSGVPVILEISTDVTELIETEEKLRESNERLWIAFGQTPNIFWEVDLETRDFTLYTMEDDINTGIMKHNVFTANFPEGLIENGMVHPDSADNFRKFARGILRGKKADTGNFIMRNQKDSNYGWVALTYRMLWNRSGIPIKAIGIRERMSSVVTGTHSMLYDRRPLPEAVRHHLIIRICVNLTEDRVEELWEEGKEWPELIREYTYSELFKKRGSGAFPFGLSQEEVFQEFQSEKLQEAYKRGERWQVKKYPGIDKGGNIRWVRAVINLQRKERNRALVMFLCVLDIQELHELENAYEGNIDYDETGQIYTMDTFCHLTNILLDRSSDQFCAMALIHVSGGVEQMDGPEVSPGKRVRDFIEIAFLFALGSDCLVGHYSDDRILVFFPTTGNRFDIKRRLEDAFIYVRTSTGDISGMENLRFIAGVTVETSEQADLDKMLHQVSSLCNVWRNASMDAVVFSDEYGNLDWDDGRDANITLASEEKLSLSDEIEEHKAAFRCTAAMLKSETLEMSLRNALEVIGKYYCADRTYELLLSEEEDRREVGMVYEWMAQGKPSIRQSVLRLKVDRIPVLQRCMQKRSAVFVERPPESDREYKWDFMAYPLLKDGQIQGFLCVENAHIHIRESGLLDLVAPYLQKEPERYRRKKYRSDGISKDILSSLPNRKDFEEMVYTLNLDRKSTMGALTVDVPELSELDNTRGFAYGKEILLNIVEALDTTFGISKVFRTGDNEFAVLFPNIIYEIFSAQCIRMRALLQKKYPGYIRVGYTWAKGVFSAEKLVEEARSLMNSEVSENQKSPRKDSLAENLSGSRGMESVPVVRYVPYFQPKIDMRDGRLVGAEALVRGIDKKGNIIKPGRFIEILEENGKIRELDFFMLESVLKQLSQWHKKEYDKITVSVNISRRTLFNPTVLASILAIQSHYPEIPSEQLELEITETAGNIEFATMADVVDRFRKFGIRFELDDFGSRYANLAVFSNVKFRTIKLDRSLINDLQSNDISRMLVENITGICKNFDMYCVAEGVENREQVDILLRLGCVYGQGYYYSKPIPAQEFEEKFLAR